MYECTIDRELKSAVALMPTNALCLLTRWRHIVAWNDVMATVLQVWHQIEIGVRQSTSIYLLEEQSYQIYADPVWNDGALGFWSSHPSKNNDDNNNNNKQQDGQDLI